MPLLRGYGFGLVISIIAIGGCGEGAARTAVTPLSGATAGTGAQSKPAPGRTRDGDSDRAADDAGRPPRPDATGEDDDDDDDRDGRDDPRSDTGRGAASPSVEWSTFNYDADNSRNNRSERAISVRNVARLSRIWQTSLDQGVTSTPIVVDGAVYVGDHGGALYKLDAGDGSQLWREPNLFAPRTSTPLVTDDAVFAAGGQWLYARSRSDGEEIWSARLNTHPQTMIDSSPTRVGDKIIIGVANYELIEARSDYTGRGAVVAVHADDGEEVWRWWATRDDENGGAGVSVWSSAAYDAERDLVYFGTGQPYELPAGRYGNALVALEAETGRLSWVNQFHADDAFTGPGGCQGGRRQPRCDFDIGASPNLFRVGSRDVVGVGSKGGLYRTVDRDDGRTVWERQLGSGSWWGGVMAVAATDDHAIYVVNNDYEDGEAIFALDMENGESIWETPMPVPVWGAVTLANGVLFLTGKDGILRALDAENGEELQTWDVRHDCAGGVSVSDGVVYVSSGFTGLGEVDRTGAAVSAFALP
jgi:polyvinyl alcohol dehydrogenase (cytochrome)